MIFYSQCSNRLPVLMNKSWNKGELKFTYETYRELLELLQSAGYRFKTFGDKMGEKSLVLRHDVDWSPLKAVRMAEIEAEYGITSTYFFLLTSPIYNLFTKKNRSLLTKIEQLGHNIGLHFSTHEYWDKDADPSKATIEKKVQAEQAAFECCVDADSISSAVSFHIPPNWVLNEGFDSFISTYDKRFLDDIKYIADSSQRWRKDPPFVDGFPKIVQLLVHPDSWGEEDKSFSTRIEEDIESYFKTYREQIQAEYGVKFDTES